MGIRHQPKPLSCLFLPDSCASHPKGPGRQRHGHMHKEAFHATPPLIESMEPKDEPGRMIQIALGQCHPLDDKRRSFH